VRHRNAIHPNEFALLTKNSALQGSSPNPGGVELIREMFEEDLERDALAVQVRRQKSEIWFTYPIVVIVAQKPVTSGGRRMEQDPNWPPVDSRQARTVRVNQFPISCDVSLGFSLEQIALVRLTASQFGTR